MRTPAAFLLGAAVAAAACWLWLPAGAQDATASLYDRINTACKTGYTVADWAANDVFGYIPEGSIVVTCENVRTADVYQVAVPR